jgi:hypothetical protein
MNIVACLVENNYWHGVSALLNSLIKNNYKGRFCIGYRGNIPNWCRKLNQTDDAIIPKTLIITLVELNCKRHLGYHKPFYLNELIKTYQPSKLYYFDVDCLPITNFDFFEKWSENHISVCMDECFTFVHKNHPWKLEWSSILEKNDLKVESIEFPYVNSGYIGLPAKHFSLITIWENITLYLENIGLNTNSFNKNPILPIQGDQEILNLTLCCIKESHLSIIGREGMGFQDPIYLMVHCTNFDKPWSCKHLSNFIQNGVSASNRDKKYFKYINLYTKSFSTFQMLLRSIDLKISSILNRIF